MRYSVPIWVGIIFSGAIGFGHPSENIESIIATTTVDNWNFCLVIFMSSPFHWKMKKMEFLLCKLEKHLSDYLWLRDREFEHEL